MLLKPSYLLTLIFHKKMKNIEVHLHFVRESLGAHDQLAEITKPLQSFKAYSFRMKKKGR